MQDVVANMGLLIDGGLEELNDEFSDGKVQFAYAKVIDPNTELPKFVFVGWCGSGVPELRKAFFNSQLSDVSKFFKVTWRELATNRELFMLNIM
ncbi:hypothetical protein G6F42_028988 [Rhizopus arrhizus]|nr:hypothetical protein G6F42_028988 [Rhizopus arrhizus]